MYSSVTDVRLALTPGGDPGDVTTAASLTDPGITDAIKEGDGWIDTYILSKYSIPTDATADPPDSVAIYPIRAWSRDLAAWFATLTFRKSKDIADEDPVYRRFLWVQDVLERIAAGTLRPNLPRPPDPPEGYGSQGAFVYNLYEGRLFRPSDMWNKRQISWIQDHRYGDIDLIGTGYDEILILSSGQSIPAGTPEDTLVVFI